MFDTYQLMIYIPFKAYYVLIWKNLSKS